MKSCFFTELRRAVPQVSDIEAWENKLREFTALFTDLLAVRFLVVEIPGATEKVSCWFHNSSNFAPQSNARKFIDLIHLVAQIVVTKEGTR